MLELETKLRAGYILSYSDKNTTEDTTARTSRTEKKNSPWPCIETV